MSKKTPGRGESWFPDPMPALLRARKRAEELARRTHTKLIESKDGRPVRVSPRAEPRRKRSKA
jgi:hypothetical protein